MWLNVEMFCQGIAFSLTIQRGDADMKLPGFTADSALCKTTRTYISSSPSFITAGTHGVLPQLPIGFCQANCDHISDPFLRSVCKAARDYGRKKEK
jgi:hypothetical protein